MKKQDMTKYDKILAKAKMQLMMLKDTVFYTTILFSLKHNWSDEIPTAAVDGRSLIINPDWFENLADKARIGLLVHELLHVALNHITRKGTKDHKIWNMAGDYIINNMITKQGYQLPSGALVDSQYKDMNTEQVYKLIFKESKVNPGSVPDNIPGIGQDIQCPKTKKERDKIEQDVADIVLQAAIQSENSGQNYGNVPGEVLIQLDRIINPKLPWNVIFQNYMQNFAKDDYSWHKPNKRFQPDHYLPTAHSETVCNIAAAVDCSGSVSDKEFNHFINEIATIQETLKPDKITVIDFDTKIHKIQDITEGSDIFTELKFTGRGGTSVKEIFAWAKDNNPEVLIVFTDGDFYQPGKEAFPECPIIWLIHGKYKFEPIVGEVIQYEID